MARPKPTDFQIVMREVNTWEKRYPNLISGTIHFPEITLHHRNNLSKSLTLRCAVDRHGNVIWYDNEWNRLPKSAGWVVREFALS